MHMRCRRRPNQSVRQTRRWLKPFERDYLPWQLLLLIFRAPADDKTPVIRNDPVACTHRCRGRAEGCRTLRFRREIKFSPISSMSVCAVRRPPLSRGPGSKWGGNKRGRLLKNELSSVRFFAPQCRGLRSKPCRDHGRPLGALIPWTLYSQTLMNVLADAVYWFRSGVDWMKSWEVDASQI